MTLRSLFTAGALVSMGVLLSRVLGLLREMLLASRYGVGHEADMAVALLVFPDFITGALLSSAVSATLVPLFTSRDREAALQLLWQALALSAGVFTLLAFMVTLDAKNIVHMVDPDSGTLYGASLALLISLSTVPLTAATSIITAYLQYKGRFTVPAFGHAIFNILIVLTLWLMPVGLTILSAGIFLGVLVRLVLHGWAFYRSGGQFLRGFWQPWQISRVMAKNYATTVTTDICNMFPQIVPYYLIAVTGSGLAVFNYAFRLSIMPAMIGHNVAQMVFLPWFAKLISDSGKSHVPQFSITLQCAWAMCLAFCLSLALASHDVAQICFGYGKMEAADIDLIGRLFAIGVWSMAPILLTGLWQQVLYAHRKPRMPLIASALQAVVIIPLCWAGRQLYGLEGAMLAVAVLQLISVALLSYDGYKQGIISRYCPSVVYGKMALVAVAVWVPLMWFYQSVKVSAWVKILLAMGIGGIILVAAISLCTPVREWTREKIRRRMKAL